MTTLQFQANGAPEIVDMMRMKTGPFSSRLEACEAFAALSNREEPPHRFISALHPLVALVSKWNIVEGSDSVAEMLGKWSTGSVNPLTHVTVLAERRREGQEPAPLCCSLYIHEPTRLQTETHLSLEDGWVKQIFVYSVWLDPEFPFPERVHEAIARLRSKGIALAPPPT